MIQAEDLCLSYGDQIVFDHASFSIQRKERAGLIGRNGSGKSTLFRVITKAEQLDSGTILVPKGYQIGILKQQISFSKPTVLEEAALGLKEEEKDCLYKVETILLGLGFSMKDLDKSPLEFSGGYQLRIQLAKVLVSEPDCLLLDEPTNYLDILSIRFLSRFLQNWDGEMILISHDLQFLDEATTHMMAIHRHQIHKIKGKSNDLFDLIAKEEELHELTRKNIEKKKAHMQSFIDRFGAKATKAAQARARQKMIDKLPSLEKLKNLDNLDFAFHNAPFMGKKMLEAGDLCFSYVPNESLIENFSLIIEKNDRIAIIGKNGYGKSTILKLLTEELSAKSGHITKSMSTKIGYFGQTSISTLDPSLTIEEEVSSANPKLTFSQVRAICGLMMFSGDLAKKSISVLSGGEKSRVLLGKIIAHPCNLLLLDEPTHHLDIESIEALIDATEDFEGAIVIVTHSEWVLRRIPFNKLIICHENRQELFLGTYDEFLEKVGWLEEQDEDPTPTKKAIEEKKKPSSSALNTQIKTCEKKIEQLEKMIEESNQKLASLSTTGNMEEIRKISLAVAKDQKLLDEQYEQLNKLYGQTEER